MSSWLDYLQNPLTWLNPAGAAAAWTDEKEQEEAERSQKEAERRGAADLAQKIITSIQADQAAAAARASV